jgi:fatty acid desaturase
MLLAPLYALGLAFAFRIEGWLFVIYRLRGRQQITEIAVLAVSLIAWLLPIRAMGWVWADDFLLGQLLAGAYLACLIAPNHKGMLTWSRGACPSFLERQVLSSRNVRPNRITDFVFGGLNYQIEHHLFPNMPRAHFCHARLLVREFCLERGLPYHEMDVVPSYRLVLSELRRVGRAAAELSPQTPSASASGPTVK